MLCDQAKERTHRPRAYVCVHPSAAWTTHVRARSKRTPGLCVVSPLKEGHSQQVSRLTDPEMVCRIKMVMAKVGRIRFCNAARGVQASPTSATARRQDNCERPVHGSTRVRQRSAAGDRDVRDLLCRATQCCQMHEVLTDAVSPMYKTLSGRSVASTHAQGPQRRSAVDLALIW